MNQAPPKPDPQHLDWTQWVWPGPRRVFSAEELARAGQQPWRRMIDHYVLGNVLVLLAINYLHMPRRQAPLIAVGSLLLTLAALWIARQLWQQPTRNRLNLFSLSAAFLLTPLVYVAKSQFGREATLLPVLVAAALLLIAVSGWWALVIFRVQQIEARLGELDEQERSLRLARRLATAQIQPHFLFNTLASLQHWVDTADPRAGPMLQSLTRYLRATLPMFEHDSHSLEAELAIVRSYLEVMQARLGHRLQWAIERQEGLDLPELPPGVLLTLVENAIAHGIEPSLRGGRVELRLRSEAGQWLLEVRDDGMGLCEPSEAGVGLSNTQARLAQLFGARARLELEALQPGCLQRIRIASSVPLSP